MTTDLQSLTDIWGRWMAKNSGTSCRFTSTTKYSDHSELGQYHEYQCTADYNSISYSSPSITDDPVIIPAQDMENGSSVTQQQTFTWSQMKQDVFTWSITESLKVGMSVTVDIGLPFFAEGKVTGSVELTLSSTQGQTKVNQRTWGENIPVQVPPMSIVTCKSIIQAAKANVEYTAYASLSGYVAIWFEQKVNNHWLWFYPIGNVIQDVLTNNLADTSGYLVQSSDAILAASYGTCRGDYGITVKTRYEQFPLPSGGAKSNDGKALKIIESNVGQIPALDY